MVPCGTPEVREAVEVDRLPTITENDFPIE